MPPITATLTAIAAIVLVLLSLPVSFRRIATKTGEGLGTDDLLHRLIRTQGNYVEYVPLALIAIYFVEAGGAAPHTVWLLGGLLGAGRLLHAAGMISGVRILRPPGMILTYASLITSAVILLTRT